jgi:acyl-CoA thioesterase I
MNAKLLAFLILGLVASPSSSRAGEEPPVLAACPVSDEFAVPDEPLDAVAAALAAGGPVNILAVGSATTVGAVPGHAPVASFPSHMLEALHAALPHVRFNLTVRGGKGMTAEDMVPLISAALAAQHYHLVIWQTGTVEAVRGVSPDSLGSALEDGVQRVQGAGADVVLVDAQFSRFLRANTDLDPYEAALQQVATMPSVVLFHRFDLMNAWADDDLIDLERTPIASRSKAVALLSTCVGNALARFILNGAALDRADATGH